MPSPDQPQRVGLGSLDPADSWSCFLIVPIDEITIQKYNDCRDPELLLNATRDSLIPENGDIQIIPGDGPLSQRAVPIKLHYPTRLDLSNYRVRYVVICQGMAIVDGWISRFHLHGEVPPAVYLCLED